VPWFRIHTCMPVSTCYYICRAHRAALLGNRRASSCRHYLCVVLLPLNCSLCLTNIAFPSRIAFTPRCHCVCLFL